MNPGIYDTLFTLLRCTTTKEGTYGEEKESYADAGQLWGSVEELAGREQDDKGATRGQAFARIRIRQYPDVTARDRLDAEGDVYVIDGIAYGANELVIDAHRYEENNV